MAGGSSFNNQSQYTIRASAPTVAAGATARDNKRPAQQIFPDQSRGLSISGQSKPAHKSPGNDMAGGRRLQHHQYESKALPSHELAIAGKSKVAQKQSQSKPRDIAQSQCLLDLTSRKRASSFATLDIVGAAPQAKPQSLKSVSIKAAKAKGGGVSISGAAATATEEQAAAKVTTATSKVDMNLPLAPTRQTDREGADAKRIKLTGGRKQRSLFGYHMETMLMNRSVSNNGSHTLTSQPRATDCPTPASSKQNRSTAEPAAALQTAPGQHSSGSAHTGAVISNSSGELKIARSACDLPGAESEVANAAPHTLRIANISAEHKTGLN
ncbi:hypothetical protein IWW47_002425 [Coemansia sp. RSA 2052]|nr:hypothetical protein IWW47_002425 [Coemansia sp. RSA 2052]